jgi:Bacteriophage translational regulator
MNQVNNMVEILLTDPEDFLKVRETLTRIGVASKKDKTLYQSCHILHKQGKYYLVHFKEMFALDGKFSNFSEEDKARRNTIANLLHEWELIDLVDPSKTKEPTVGISQIKIIPYAEKKDWNLVPKYNLGNKKKEEKDAR